jgi:hypothetical protein
MSVLSLPARCSWLSDVGGREKLVHEKTPARADSFQRLSEEETSLWREWLAAAVA